MIQAEHVHTGTHVQPYFLVLWLAVVAVCLAVTAVQLVRWAWRRWRASHVRAAMDNDVPKYTCPSCGRKSVRHRFGDGASMAEATASFQRYCPRCGWMGQ